MTLNDTEKIIFDIKSYRPFFQTGNSKKEETTFVKSWFKVFEPYSYDEVNINLDKWFKSSNNFGKTPTPHELIHGLLTETEKQKLKDKNAIRIYCPICNSKFGLVEFESHYSRCSSVKYIVDCREKYYNKTTNSEKLFSLSDEKFDEIYMNFVKELKKVLTNEQEIKCIDNLLNSWKGREYEKQD